MVRTSKNGSLAIVDSMDAATGEIKFRSNES